MAFRITAGADHLRAELTDRKTVEETQAFLRAVVRENAKHRKPCVLLLIRLSKPVFQVAAHGLIEHIEEISMTPPGCRIAVVGDTRDLQISHEYIELLAQQRNLKVRSFRNEIAALQWLKDQRKTSDRRQRTERRALWDRRQGDRRGAQEGGGAGSAIPEPAPAR